ncbi:glycoside hydrolase superfamily [Russula vinacea]|nr:glycoside hydrolase superfamily [Russula vinacea]
MRLSAALILLTAARASAAPSLSTLSSTSFPLPLPLSSTHSGASPPPTPLSSPSVTSTPSSPSLSSSGSSSSSLRPPVLVTIPSVGMFTEAGPSVFPTTPYYFAPFPSPSSEPPILGVYPASSPKHPPPVGSPALVPDFAPAWARAYQKAKAKVQTWSLEEKVDITTGLGWINGRCAGNIRPINDFPGLCLEDSPLGVRGTDFVTAFPAAINAASTWKRSLLRARGVAMGQEHVGKGVNIALGPMMNMGRVAQGGRNWEGFGADPFWRALEHMRPSSENQRTLEISNVDDRTQHEIYVAPFLRSVMAGLASVMCSYDLVNGTYACENNNTLNGILKNELGFQGFVMSDWYAQHSTISAVTGLDMSMPGDIFFVPNISYFGANLTAYVENGTIPEARVDDMATRILASWYFLGQDSPNYPKTNFNQADPLDEATNEHIDVQDDHRKLVREIDTSSIVLLKNVNDALPLKKPRKLVLVGSDAAPAHIAGPSEFSDQGGVDGVLAVGWGSGTVMFTYKISPYEAFQARARIDHTAFSWFFDDFNLVGAATAAVQQDVAIVFLQSDSGEGYITVDGNAVIGKTSQHGLTGMRWSKLSRRKQQHDRRCQFGWPTYLGTGSETGNALVDVIYGAVNPSGRLPYTIAKSPQDYPAQLVLGGNGEEILNITYSEGLFVDYRHFDAANIAPRYEFGFGMSYTSSSTRV